MLDTTQVWLCTCVAVGRFCSKEHATQRFAGGASIS